MADALWPFAEQFRTCHTSPPNGPLSFFRLANEFGQVHCPLIFEGTTKALSQLFDPEDKPPYPLCNHPHVNFRNFVCWLQLPADVTGDEWYFGCVYFDEPRDEQRKFIADFRELASKAGSCLRSNRRFREWLWLCLQFLSQADRYRELLDGADAAWWMALLFTKPDSQLLQAACSRKVDGDILRLEIGNPAVWSKQAIVSHKLCNEPPLWPVEQRVVRPFREIPCPNLIEVCESSIPANETDDKAKATLAVEARFSWKVDGENFVIRFDSEAGSFRKSLVGFQRYRRLLQSRDHRMSMVELCGGQTDQRVTNDLHRSVDLSVDEEGFKVIAQERKRLEDERDEARKSGDSDTVAEREAEVKKIDDWTAKQTRPITKKDGKRRRVARNVNDPFASFRSTVLTSFEKAREKMIDGNMPRLAGHLEDCVRSKNETGEVVYSETGAVAWVFE